MFKDFLKKCASVLNRDDIYDELSSKTELSEIANQQIQNDIVRLINYYNFILKAVCEDYIELVETETIFSNNEGRFYYSNLTFEPVKILNVYDINLNEIRFIPYPEFIDLYKANETYMVKYKYLPKDIVDLNSNIETKATKAIPDKLLIYGIVSEFLASKNKYNESEYWKNKFMYELFKYKLKKGRRLKSTFCK